MIFLLIESGGSFWSPTPSFHSKHKLSALLLLNSASSWCCLFDPSGGLWAMLARTLWDNWYNNRRFAHVYMQSGGPIRDRLLHHTRWYCIILFFLETGFTFTSISPLSTQLRPLPRPLCRAWKHRVEFLFYYLLVFFLQVKEGHWTEQPSPTYHKHPVEFTAWW